MGPPFQKTALDAVKRFRTRELAGLMSHLRIFGPLPEPPASSTKKGAAPPIVLPNPFLPKKNPKTGKWRPPKYSLRRQAELVKMAKASGTLSSLPPGPKKFATELRMERVKASLSASELANSRAQASTSKPKGGKERKTPAKRIQELQAIIEDAQKSLPLEREKLKAVTSAYDLGELTTFEGETGQGGKESTAKLAEHRAAQEQRAGEKLLLEVTIKNFETTIKANEEKILTIREKIQRKREMKKNTINWNKVSWAGEADSKKVAGTELGTRLYTGKKRMFKGHLWERKRARRIRRHTILMRDMPARIERYKDYYKKRRPNPLKPSRYTKPPKLPF